MEKSETKFAKISTLTRNTKSVNALRAECRRPKARREKFIHENCTLSAIHLDDDDEDGYEDDDGDDDDDGYDDDDDDDGDNDDDGYDDDNVQEQHLPVSRLSQYSFHASRF